LIKIATNIKTDLFFQIVAYLEEDWTLVSEYQGKKKGENFDGYHFKNGKRSAVLKWDRFLGGDLKADTELLHLLEQRFEYLFDFGRPNHLRLSIAEMAKNAF